MTGPLPGEEEQRKPGLGLKWSCYECGAKFYDLNKPEPVCPKCGTDQRNRPKRSPGAPAPAPAASSESRRPAAAPMSRLLAEEEEAAVEEPLEEEEESSATELDISELEEGAGYLGEDRGFEDEDSD